MSKINVHDFLEQNGEDKQYAIVEYDGKKRAVCYINNDSKHAIYVNCKDKWSGFSLTLEGKVSDDLDILWEILYVENIEFRPPNEVDNISLITEKECLKYLTDVEFKETVESSTLKQEVKRNIVNDLKQSNDFDSVAIDKIMEVFDKATDEYTFHK